MNLEIECRIRQLRGEAESSGSGGWTDGNNNIDTIVELEVENVLRMFLKMEIMLEKMKESSEDMLDSITVLENTREMRA